MSSDVKWFIGIVLTAGLALATLIVGCAGYIVMRLDSLDARLRTVEQVQAQHSVKLDQLLAAESSVETETLTQSLNN